MTQTIEHADLSTPSDASVLEAFAEVQHADDRSLLKRAGAVAVVAFVLVAAIAIATSDRVDDSAPEIALDASTNPTVPPLPEESVGQAPSDSGGDSGSSPVPSSGRSPGGSAGVVSGADPGMAGSDATPTDGDGAGGAQDVAPPSPEPDVAPPSPEPDESDIGLLTGTLDILTFVSEIGLPLVCNVASSALLSQIPPVPAVGEVASTIVSSCIEFGTDGGVALRELNRQLEALEVLNPLTAPVIDGLADLLAMAGGLDVPFTDSLVAIGELIRFFSPTAPEGP